MTYNQELVSIITPVYNSRNYIKDTIESVLKQTYVNWEMIIVDDKSTDNSIEIIKKIAAEEKRIKLICLEENKGAAVARNIAIENAKGRYIAFLDSDDKWKSNKLEIQLNYMREEKLGFTFSKYEYILDNNNQGEKVFNVPTSVNYKQLLMNNVIGCLTVIIDRNIIGDFRMPLVRKGQDNLTWLMILKKGNVAYGIQEILGEYRKVKGSLSNNKIKALKRQWINYREYEKLGILKCVYYYSIYVINNIKKYIYK